MCIHYTNMYKPSYYILTDNMIVFVLLYVSSVCMHVGTRVPRRSYYIIGVWNADGASRYQIRSTRVWEPDCRTESVREYC